jgi:chorismate lyase/3-hydroxybenzoate synthase
VILSAPSTAGDAAGPLAPARLRFAPDRAQPEGIELPVAWLHGVAVEALFPAATPAGESAGFRLWRAEGFVVGAAAVAAEPDLADQARMLYDRLLTAAEGRPLCRVWNYVPDINEHGADGLENYRAFCLGRARAFEAAQGAGFETRLPAASAVGGERGQLSVVFVAAETVSSHVENPEQIPAYRYPAEHGPRPPSFSRASLAHDGVRPWVFISGTAAIKGHATVAPGALDAQIACTLDNLRLVSRACALGDDLGRSSPGRWHRQFKIYLRHAADLPAARAALEGSLLSAGDEVIWLRADICRAALRIEIEATLRGVVR